MMRTGKTLAAVALAAVLAASQPVIAQNAGQVRIKIGQLREEMALEEEKLQKSTEEERAVLEELDKLGSRMDEQQGKINLLQKQLEEQRQNLAKTEEARQQTAQARDKALRHMLDRLRAFYTLGRLGALNVTFSSRTLPELLLMHDSFRSMAAYDRTVIEKYRASLTALKQAQTAHELEESLLEELVRQAEEQRLALNELRVQREEVLTRIKAEQGLIQLAMQEMRQAEAKFIRSLSQPPEAPPFNGPGLLPDKGSLPFPAGGKLTQRFGEPLKEGFRKGEKTSGIHIAVEPETEVRAVQKGRVLSAGYQNNYGNAVVIDHGQGWISLTSRLDAVFVREGEIVGQNQKIGVSGDLATLFEPGLYFEIRQKGAAQDPLQWLKLKAE
jgi:septal ring factor EnvC (AmiA/AmiB activator)